jgi:hypothetical protein
MVTVEAFGTKAGDVLGSGFIVNANGVLVTNLHVVDGAKSVRVKTDSGDIFDQVGLVETDERRDLAVLKIKASGLPPVTIGDSDTIKTGQKIWAIGNSAALTNTITEGLISGVRRAEEVPQLRASGYQVLQISAAIWHGASGGVVVNDQGQVIGVPYAGLDSAQNIGFAIPAKYVLPLISENVRTYFDTASIATTAISPPSITTSSIGSSILAGLEPAIPPDELLKAKTVYVGYISGNRSVFENLPKRLNDWKRWKIVAEEKDADVLLVYYQSGYDALTGDELTLAAVSKSGRKLLSVNCARRLSAGYTAGVLINRMKDRILKAEPKGR